MTIVAALPLTLLVLAICVGGSLLLRSKAQNAQETQYIVVPEGEMWTEDIDAFLSEQVARHGGYIEAMANGYRHVWADGTRKLYTEA